MANLMPAISIAGVLVADGVHEPGGLHRAGPRSEVTRRSARRRVV